MLANNLKLKLTHTEAYLRPCKKSVMKFFCENGVSVNAHTKKKKTRETNLVQVKQEFLLKLLTQSLLICGDCFS